MRTVSPIFFLFFNNILIHGSGPHQNGVSNDILKVFIYSGMLSVVFCESRNYHIQMSFDTFQYTDVSVLSEVCVHHLCVNTLVKQACVIF